MENQEFEKKIADLLDAHKSLAIRQENHPSEEHCNAMTDAFNAIIQTVMDEVGERQDWVDKFNTIKSFDKVIRNFYGLSKYVPDSILMAFYERMLLKSWGVNNPHDPFNE